MHIGLNTGRAGVAFGRYHVTFSFVEKFRGNSGVCETNRLQVPTRRNHRVLPLEE